ncbi:MULTISPECIES: energy-coupling factor ABC transporter ATP-binding protein [unclassified Aureimonas]|uniref:energy-coupling factor ABC transporter ATP-binding protein n=1 Tax=unclassified Aureimonas TaxID=2615206 RepID=UPI0006FBDD56|nr:MULTISPECIES: ABC transporter ATP-binding protein [unclassified Aureimonas]KQT69028.1 cobalt ABC transporter ATP-binding protein [Aureimonas sp. Leaf460]KQT69262.1 cobalt ABC transporter ATP-binding protein [Aureimonas sp. Leaf427]
MIEGPGAGRADVEIEGVELERAGRLVLSGLTLSLRERRIGIIGANGSGKSSFARLLNGLLLPTSGGVRVFGRDTAGETRAVRREVGFLFQNPDHQIVYPTVAEDLAFGLKNRGLSKAEIAPRVEAALARFGLGGFGGRLCHELSGGERQMVALAGIMVLEPRLLVLDEPTTLLDLRNTRRIMAAIETAIETGGQACVLVTHDLALLEGFDRVLVFESGRLVFDGGPAEAIGLYRRLAA